LYQPHLAHATNAEFLQQSVRTDDLRLSFDFPGCARPGTCGKLIGIDIGRQQRFDFSAQLRILRADLCEIGGAMGRRALQNRTNDLLNFLPWLELLHTDLASSVWIARPWPRSIHASRSSGKYPALRPLLLSTGRRRNASPQCGLAVCRCGKVG